MFVYLFCYCHTACAQISNATWNNFQVLFAVESFITIALKHETRLICLIGCMAAYLFWSRYWCHNFMAIDVLQCENSQCVKGMFLCTLAKCHVLQDFFLMLLKVEMYTLNTMNLMPLHKVCAFIYFELSRAHSAIMKHLSHLQREACSMQPAATSNSCWKVYFTVRLNSQEWSASKISSAKSGRTWLHSRHNAVYGINFFLCTFTVCPHHLSQQLECTCLSAVLWHGHFNSRVHCTLKKQSKKKTIGYPC